MTDHDDYDAAADAAGNYSLAIAWLRQELLRRQAEEKGEADERPR